MKDEPKKDELSFAGAFIWLVFEHNNLLTSPANAITYQARERLLDGMHAMISGYEYQEGKDKELRKVDTDWTKEKSKFRRGEVIQFSNRFQNSWNNYLLRKLQELIRQAVSLGVIFKEEYTEEHIA